MLKVVKQLLERHFGRQGVSSEVHFMPDTRSCHHTLPCDSGVFVLLAMHHLLYGAQPKDWHRYTQAKDANNRARKEAVIGICYNRCMRLGQ